MGNTLGSKRTTKIMKISGETMKLKTPLKAIEVLKDHPGHVLLESESVKHYGIRAKPLDPHQNLVPKRVYFLVELPSTPTTEKGPRRVRSGINMTAKDRLESLMLSRRSISDLSIINNKSSASSTSRSCIEEPQNGVTRLKLRLPKGELEKLIKESKDEAEISARIVDLCAANSGTEDGDDDGHEIQQQVHWKSEQIISKKRVSFLPKSTESEIQVAVASY